MPIFSFRGCARDSGATVTTSEEFPDDLAAMRHAQRLVPAYPAADSVTAAEAQRHLVHVPGVGASRQVAAAMEAVARSKEAVAASLPLLSQEREKADELLRQATRTTDLKEHSRLITEATYWQREVTGRWPAGGAAEGRRADGVKRRRDPGLRLKMSNGVQTGPPYRRGRGAPFPEAERRRA